MGFIVTTENRDFEPLGGRILYPWEILRERLSRELGPDFRMLLAEPVTEPGWGKVDWYTEATDLAQCASDIDMEARFLMFDRLIDMRISVNALADRIETSQRGADPGFAQALRRAMAVPDDEKFVWSTNGQPVLVCWGQLHVGEERDESTILRDCLLSKRPSRQENSSALSAAPSTRAAAATPSVSGMPIQKTETSNGPQKRWTFAGQRLPLTAILWAVCATISGAIFWLLLQGCLVSGPSGENWLSRYLPNSCLAFADPLISERKKKESLIRKIQSARQNIAQSLENCSAPTKPPDASPTDPSIQDRLKREHVEQEGKAEVSLSWNGPEDLDLHIKCLDQNAEIYHGALKACGGELDKDMNFTGEHSLTPVEHIFWRDTPPPGRYEILVSARGTNGASPRDIPFTVRVRRDQSLQNYTLIMPQSKVDQKVATFTQ